MGQQLSRLEGNPFWPLRQKLVGDAFLQLTIAAGKWGDRVGDDLQVLDVERVTELKF
jgi:hypothetical protein